MNAREIGKADFPGFFFAFSRFATFCKVCDSFRVPAVKLPFF
jgi:hypothetical protein